MYINSRALVLSFKYNKRKVTIKSSSCFLSKKSPIRCMCAFRQMISLLCWMMKRSTCDENDGFEEESIEDEGFDQCHWMRILIRDRMPLTTNVIHPPDETHPQARHSIQI